MSKKKKKVAKVKAKAKARAKNAKATKMSKPAAAKPAKVAKPRGKVRVVVEPTKYNRKEYVARVEGLREDMVTLRDCLGDAVAHPGESKDAWASAAEVRVKRAIYSLDHLPGLTDRTDVPREGACKITKRETVGAFRAMLHYGEKLIASADVATDQAESFEFYQKAKDVLRGATLAMRDPLEPIVVPTSEPSEGDEEDGDEDGGGGGDSEPDPEPTQGGAETVEDHETAPTEPVAETTPEPVEATASAPAGRWGAEPEDRSGAK